MLRKGPMQFSFKVGIVMVQLLTVILSVCFCVKVLVAQRKTH